ncbi:DMT family transporter [Celeribacter marinus]|uniref:Arginine/ornithine antiporter ArcD n=1 Tax=Celeribacter marinus TaxID=1397108 RepID=A0A0N9ZZ02_9RHOB|nr:DMT family transporter [Celeribacter marinus]ALI55518.1 arginine/ornithine antiporter ArcD [Celeribacter marinus]SFK21351.1 Permease of the drug/metabolite transporter (DMT) superfamily [Celeribacter marinus]
MTDQNPRLGILLMVVTMFIFAMQDGLSRHLAGEYNVYMVIMIRYWVFAAFVIMWSARTTGGLARAARSAQPKLQFFRGALLAVEVIIMVIGFVKLGLVESHAIFATYPLIITALSGPILGERVGWRRWLSVAIGFFGVMIILMPDGDVFSPAVIFPLASAAMFALYGLLNRYVSRKDPAAVTFFYTGISGAAVMTLIGVWFWEPMSLNDWTWMITLCASAIVGHYLLIRAYELSEASAIQPFAYLQLAFASGVGVVFFGDIIRLNVAIGTSIVVGAGIFALVRAQLAARRARSGAPTAP